MNAPAVDPQPEPQELEVSAGHARGSKDATASRSGHDGLWDVRVRSLEELEAHFSATHGDANGARLPSIDFPARLIVGASMDPARIERLRESVEAMAPAGHIVRTRKLPPSGWIGVLKNVPPPRTEDTTARTGVDPRGDSPYGTTTGHTAGAEAPEAIPDSSKMVVTVTRNTHTAPEVGPILVLAGLKYRGNVGTIIRSAVQANIFEAIYFIDEREEGPPSALGVEHPKWAEKAKAKVTDNDMDYYSMNNGPLVYIRRFPTVDGFLEVANKDARRQLVCIDTGEVCIDAYSPDAIKALGQPEIYMVMGAEDLGTPAGIIRACQSSAGTIVTIPHLSASINVSCAFMVVLTIMHMCSKGSIVPAPAQ